MQLYKVIIFNRKDQISNQIKDMFISIDEKRAYQQGMDNRAGLFVLKIIDNDERLKIIFNFLHTNRIEYSERIEAKYSDSYLEQFDYFTFLIRSAPMGEGGPTFGTEFDLNTGCKSCGTGIYQKSDLRLRESDLPKKTPKIFETLDGEYLISQEIAEKFQEFISEKDAFRQVESSTKHQPLAWWQIIPSTVMPKVSKKTKGIIIEEQCNQCHRDGHFHTLKEPLQIYYNYKEVDKLKIFQIAKTWECFGN